MAHLLEHMLFKGTPKHRDIRKEFRERGARTNGTTSYDRTNYFESFRASDANLEWALELEADRMVNSFIAKKDLDSEMTVVRNEMESRENDPINILRERIMEAAFTWHNYGKTMIGARSDVENVPIERLQAFYKRFYRPDNAVLIVTGKVEEQRVIELVHKHFSAIPKPGEALPRYYTVEPAQDGERLVTLRRVGDFQLAMVGYHAPPEPHPDWAAVQLAVWILGRTPGGRLHKSLVETKKATGVAGSTLGLRESSYIWFTAALRKGEALADVREALEKAVEGLIENPPSKEEIENARTRFLNAYESTMTDPESVADSLHEASAVGDWRIMFLTRDNIRKVGAEDIKRVAATYLKRSNRTVGLFIPTEKADRVEIPAVSDDEIAAMVKGYKGDVALAEGEAFDATYANIEARTIRSKIGNLQTAMLPKKTRGNRVLLRLSLHLGNEKSLMDRGTAGAFAGSMLMLGTAKRTRQQIDEELAKLKATGNVSGSATAVGAAFETTRQNLPALMRLVAEMLREPAFPASELEQLRQRALVNVESQRSDPGSIVSRALQRHASIRPKGHVYYTQSFEEQIAAYKAVTLEEVKAFHRDFYGVANGQLTIVGDFDATEMAALAKELFGGWESKTPYVRIASEHREFPVINKSFETPDKANAVFVAYHPMKLRDDDRDYLALELGNNILGIAQGNRLFERLRKKDGLTYGINSQVSAGTLDPVGSFTATAITAPENAGRLEAGFKEEIARILKDGITAQELETTRKGALENLRVVLSDDSALSGGIHSLLYYNRTMAWIAAQEKQVEATTVEDVNRAVRRFIAPDKMIILKAGDFANANRRSPNQKAKE
jgi:zinc protease